MIGSHFMLYSNDADADRAFLRDVLGLGYADVGGGWLIFRMPPAELGVHPMEGEAHAIQQGGRPMGSVVLYLMCADLDSTMESLLSQGVEVDAVQRLDWGISTSFRLPSGAWIGLYQPFHPTAI